MERWLLGIKPLKDSPAAWNRKPKAGVQERGWVLVTPSLRCACHRPGTKSRVQACFRVKFLILEQLLSSHSSWGASATA